MATPHRKLTCRVLLLLTFTASTPFSPTQAEPKGIVLPPTVRTVGPGGPPCDYSNIQDAIDASASGDTVRVYNNITYAGVHLDITNKSLSLVGGYSSCDDTTSDPTNLSTINTAGFGSAVLVSSFGPAQSSVLIRNFSLYQGAGGASAGGGVDLEGNVRLRLDNVRVYGGTADYGAGIRMHDGVPGPVLRLEGGTLIGTNSIFANPNYATQQGGGIHCVGGTIEWVDAHFAFNFAAEGGGLYLDNCDLSMPAIANGGLRTVEIRDNGATASGGGIQAVNGSTMSLSSSARRQVRIGDNQSGTAGGAIRMVDSSYFGAGVHIESNRSDAESGGVSISGGSFNNSRGNPDGSECADQVRCSVMSENESVTFGAATSADNGAVVNIRQTFIEGNQSQTSPVALSTGGSLVTLTSTQIAGNSVTAANSRLLTVADGSTLDLRNVSLAGNTSDLVFSVGTNSTLDLSDSIIWQPGTAIASVHGTASLNGSCVNASDLSIPFAVTHHPGFMVDPNVSNPTPLLALADDSANLDACDNLPLSNPLYDVIGRWRVEDLPDVPNGDGVLDRGAFEMIEPLFKDGFED